MGWDIGAHRPAGSCSAPRSPTWSSSTSATTCTASWPTTGSTVDDVAAWVSHPGGPKVIEAIETALGLPADALELTWRSLAEVGNLSSASVLHVLRDTLRGRRPVPGAHGLLLAMGPGFCSELVLLRW